MGETEARPTPDRPTTNRPTIDLNYVASPTASRFHASNAYVRGILGPVGSGKSVACIWEMLKRSMEQAQAPDGLRYTRWLVVRNTYGELLNTTMKTFDEWFPQEVFGSRGGAHGCHMDGAGQGV